MVLNLNEASKIKVIKQKYIPNLLTFIESAILFTPTED